MMFNSKSSESVSFAGSSLIKGRWKVLKKIGAGAFGEIFSGKNVITNEMVAIKVERVDNKKQVLKLEVAVLKKLQACPFVCRFITCGRFNEYNYMIMELLGENLSELRRRQPDGRFSMGTALKLGIQMMKALEAVHDLGYIHRDVKPSNYAMGLTGVKRHTTFLIDFGLARRYLLSGGEAYNQMVFDNTQARDSTGFRGTARYASINSHLSKDLGRRDDLWSIFYMLIEFIQGQLPWRKLKDKDQIGDMKVKYNTPELVKDLPPQFLAFMKHLKSLNYADRPDYNHLYNLLLDLYHSLGFDDHTPFDWEVNTPLRSPYPATSPLIASTEDVKMSEQNKSTVPLNPRGTLEDEPMSPNTLSPHHSQHNSNPNNKNKPFNSPDNNSNRRDTESVIAASTSTEEKQTGSWGEKEGGGKEKKSSPQVTASAPTNKEASQLSGTPAKAKPVELVSGPPLVDKPKKDKDPREQASCRCIIM